MGNYLSSLSMSHYGMSEPCLGTVNSYATLMKMKPVAPNEEAARKEAQRLIKLIDKDGDAKLSKDDLYKHFCSTTQKRKQIMEEGSFHYNWAKLLDAKTKQEYEEEAMQIWSEDARQYHDLDKDGVITVDELSYNLLHWSVVQNRLKSKQKLTKSKKSPKLFKTVLEEEKNYMSKHFCQDQAACPELDELTRYGESCMKNKGKMQKTLKRMFEMLEQEDQGDSEVLDVVDRQTGASKKAAVKELKSEL